MKNNPKVSIVIPTYNRLNELAELMESLSQQTYKNFEVIIVNDCGDSIEVLSTLYPELEMTIINLKENMHHVYARNVGVTKAKGEFIMLIDDDDLIVPTHIETMMNAIKGHDLVYSDVEIIDYDENAMIGRIAITRKLFAYTYDLEEMKKFSTFVPSGCLYRNEIHQTIGLFDEEVRNYWDWDFFLRVAENFKVNRVNYASVLYSFSQHGNNQSKDLEKMRNYLNILSEKHNLGFLPTKNFFLLLEEPQLKAREARSNIVWDGEPILSRLAHMEYEGKRKIAY